MTPADRKECVAMLRAEADASIRMANVRNSCDGPRGFRSATYAERRETWERAARANLLAAAADEIEKGGAP